MLIYNAVFLLLLLFSLLDLGSKKNIFLFLIPLSVLLMLTGLRGNGGDDFFVYEEYFNSIPHEIFNYGYGYYALNVAVKYFYDYCFFIFISSFICLSLQSFFIYRESNAPCYVLFLFYSTSFLWLDFILIRQSIAVGFVVIAIIFYKNNCSLLSFLFFILASFFHETALFAGILFYLFVNVGKACMIVSIISLLLISPFLQDIIIIINQYTIKNSNIHLYIDEHSFPSLSNISELLMAIASFNFLKAGNDFNNKKEIHIYQSILITCFIILILSYTIPSLARFIEYFRLFYFVLMSKVLMQLGFGKRCFFLASTAVYCFIRFNIFLQQFDSGFDYIFNGFSI